MNFFSFSGSVNDVYFIILIILFALAISDLVIGVSNDAVNFLNSAIGSRSGSRRLILWVAAMGVVGGAAFSGGMMEVARKGIFNPGAFVFSELMVVFFAVMITDIVLLDLFNTLGFPTSTTVSIVFELMGASVAMATVKIFAAGDSLNTMGTYINTDKALAIIAGILSSVIIAFTVSLVVQKIVRFLFSFKFEIRLKYFGSLYAGIAIAVITHFMIVKGAKGAAFLSAEKAQFLYDNMIAIMIYSIIGWTVVLQMLKSLFRVDVLKVVVLTGTFALAWAFASNDLVNFIGVPLAGFSSFKAWIGSGAAPETLGMDFLSGPVNVPVYMLLGAGLIMATTLFYSRKAQAVMKTSLDLSRQSEGEERFASWPLPRIIVGVCVKGYQVVQKIIPDRIERFVARQFEQPPVDQCIPVHERPVFDKLRAATNLLVASVLISIGTSYKLPLSTTYVVFMVGMGTSLADRAWGRESAVYRISGVFAVIGGWFMTALIAFTCAFIVARVIAWGGFGVIMILCVAALFQLVRTQRIFRRKEKAKKVYEEDVHEPFFNTQKVLHRCTGKTIKAIDSVIKIYQLCFDGFINGDRQMLKEALAETEEFNIRAKKQKDGVLKNIHRLNEDCVDTGHFYVQVADYLREMAHSVRYLAEPIYSHYDNRHKPFTSEQAERITKLRMELEGFFTKARSIIESEDFDEIDNLIDERNEIIAMLKELEKMQIRQIKNNEVSTRNSMLYFNIVTETKNILLHLTNAMKSLRDFIVLSQSEITHAEKE